MRWVQLMATQGVRDRYVACVTQFFSLLILYRNNDNPKVNCYVARWQHFSNRCIKNNGAKVHRGALNALKPAGEGCHAVSIWGQVSDAVPGDICLVVWPCDALSALQTVAYLSTLLLYYEGTPVM